MNIKISIIVAVYNTEKYLKQCLDSCISQTLKEIEIIIIDDASTDNSWNILTEYAKKDSRIKIFKQDHNMRQGAARNRGVQEACGEYIWFVDSDDYINPEACQLLYDTAKFNNVQVLTFNLISFNDETNDYIESGYYFDWPKNTNINLKNNQSMNGDFTVQPCSYISKRDYLINHKFRENVVFEDTDFSVILFAECSTLRNIVYTAYHRRYHNSSTTRSRMTLKKLEDRLAVVIELDKYIKNKNIQKNSFVYNFTHNYANFACNEIKNSEFYNSFETNKEFLYICSKYTDIKDSIINKIIKKSKRAWKFILPYGIVKFCKSKGLLLH